MKIEWAKVESLFEAGVDRGVLYPHGGQAGVPWVGITSVSVDVDGGAVTPYYYDGQKYAEKVGAEFFKATLSALAYPHAFEWYGGNKRLAPGLLATMQPREDTFGLSWRTRLGDQGQDIDFGYRIHLVWNAIAAPNPKQYGTLTQSTDPSSFTWTITAMAPPAVGYKPTAYLVVDSTKMDPDKLAELERMLYGSDPVLRDVIDGGRVTDPPTGIVYDAGRVTDISTGPVIDGRGPADGLVRVTNNSFLPSQAEIIELLNA